MKKPFPLAECVAGLFLAIVIVILMMSAYNRSLPHVVEAIYPHTSLENLIGKEKIALVCEEEKDELHPFECADYVLWVGHTGGFVGSKIVFHDKNGNELFLIRYYEQVHIVEIDKTLYKISSGSCS